MGVIDDLRHQSDALHSRHQADEDHKQGLEECYQQLIKPRMSALFKYLQELVQHLNFVAPDIQVEYRCFRGDERRFDFTQKNYSLRANSADETMHFYLSCEAVAVRSHSIKTKSESVANAHAKELQQYGISTSKRPLSLGEAAGGFQVDIVSSVPIAFEFHSDNARCEVVMTLHNYAEFGTLREIFKPEQLSDQWLDDIGALIIRKSDRLIRRSLSVEERVKIKQRLAMQREREQDHRREKEEGKGGMRWNRFFKKG